MPVTISRLAIRRAIPPTSDAHDLNGTRGLSETFEPMGEEPAYRVVIITAHRLDSTFLSEASNDVCVQRTAREFAVFTSHPGCLKLRIFEARFLTSRSAFAQLERHGHGTRLRGTPLPIDGFDSVNLPVIASASLAETTS